MRDDTIIIDGWIDDRPETPPPSVRLCKIVEAAIELENGAGDGSELVFGPAGSPDEIGKAIANELAHADMIQGAHGHSILSSGRDLYLVLKIKFSKA